MQESRTTQGLLTSSPSLELLFRLKIAWRHFAIRLAVLDADLARHATSLEEQLTRVDPLNKTWEATLQSAKQPATPPQVLQSVVDSIDRTRQAAEARAIGAR
jgi:hypothetical protein